MTKHVSISANENPLYLFYLPLTCWAWNKFGWKPLVILVREAHPSKNEHIFQLVERSIGCDRIVSHINAQEFVNHGYETATIAQLSRLYAAISIKDEDILMTGDSDMIPLSDYWKFSQQFPIIYGWDLTNFKHTPICYICMNKAFWLRTMEISKDTEGIHGMLPFIWDDLRKLPQAKSENKEQRWCCDQDLITERINTLSRFVSLGITNRGMYTNGYPIGRVDRSAWSQNHEQYIDCHAPHDILTNPESRLKLLQLLKFIWPNEDFTWWKEYQKEFLELLKPTNQ